MKVKKRTVFWRSCSYLMGPIRGSRKNPGWGDSANFEGAVNFGPITDSDRHWVLEASKKGKSDIRGSFGGQSSCLVLGKKRR